MSDARPADAEADADVVVVGGGIAGLAIADDLARASSRVIVCEASDAVGGLLRRGRLAGLDVDLGAESFATRTDAVAALVADAGLPLEIVAPRPGGAHLAVAADGEDADAPGAPLPRRTEVVRAPLPRRTVLGIPADPLADDVVRLIGASAAARVAAEIELPFTDEAEPSLFDLVAARCGDVLATRVVDTLCRSVYSRPAAEVRLSALHPGLWRAYRERGSLVAAAGVLAQDARAGAAVAGIAGGMWRLPDALARAATAHGARVRTGTAVREVSGSRAAGFVVRTDAGAITARRVVIAAGPAAAARLVEPRSAEVAPASGTDAPASGAAVPGRGGVRVVAVVVDHADLDAFPVGSGVIVDAALPTAAKALTHVSAKWAWAAAAAPAGRHVLRLSARDPYAPGLDDPADVARELSLLTGVEVGPADIVDLTVQDWPDAVAAGDADRLRRAARSRGLDLAGAVVAGTGLAAVLPHARALAADLLGDDASAHALPVPSVTP